MPHVITSLCLRDGACVDACPSEAIIPGMPENEWPWYYIDPDACIDCAACAVECPFEAIFEESEVPDEYEMAAGQQRMPHDGPLFTAQGGEIVDLTEDIQYNYDFFESGPGYDAAP
jgi:ferredoxin